MVTELLHAEGAKVDVASGGVEALCLLHELKTGYDAVLMDIQMPDMDGYAATRRIRAMSGLEHLSIIAMTANVLLSDRQACLDAGMNDHIGKPFNLDDLVGRLRQWTGRLPEGEEPVARPSTTAATAVDAPSVALDRRGALARMGGNQRVYDAALAAFPAAASQLLDVLGESSAADARADALRHLHTLKGLAATVGAQQLARTVAEQEHAVQQRAPGQWADAVAVDALRDALARAAEESATPTTAAAPAGAEPGHAVTQAQLQELAALLDASNLRSLDVYTALAPQMATQFPQMHQRIDSALGELDFDAALSACGALLLSEWDTE